MSEFERNSNENLPTEMADAIAEALFPVLVPRPIRQPVPGVPTPGTWRLNQSTGDIVTDVDGSEYVIAWTDADSYLNEEEQLANGKLIAQAKIFASVAKDLVAAWNKCDATQLHSIILRAQLALSLAEVR